MNGRTELKMHKYVRLYANCIPVKGFNRTAVCDLQNNLIKFVPNDLYDLLINEFRFKNIGDVLSNFAQEDAEIIIEYIDYIIKEELAFLVDKEDVQNFIDYPLEFDVPNIITNCIIDFDNKFPILGVLPSVKVLSECNCCVVQIRCFNHNPAKEDLEYLVEQIQQSNINAIEILFKYERRGYNLQYCTSLLNTFKKINTVTLHSAPKAKSLPIKTAGNSNIILTRDIVSSPHCCGIVSQQYFAINILHFTESLNHNTCLNRKVSIDSYGNIKNCPSMKESYGNVKDVSIKSIINQDGFRKHWNVSKNSIDTCKDCEFRHVCTDCRVYIEDPKNDNSKPLKCGYNPYTCEWEDWENNEFKKQIFNSHFECFP